MRHLTTYRVEISCPDYWDAEDALDALAMLEEVDMRDALATIAENMLASRAEFGSQLAVSVEDRP
jgi:hypothetical protein